MYHFFKGKNCLRVRRVKILILIQVFCLLLNMRVYAQPSSGNVTIGTDFSDNIAAKNWTVSDPPVHCGMRVINRGTESVHVSVSLWEYFELSTADYIYSDQRHMIDQNGDFVKFAVTGEIESQLDDIRADAVWESFISDPANREAYTNALDASDFTKIRGLYDTQEYWYKLSKSGDPNGQYGTFVVVDKTLTPIPVVGGVKGDASTYERMLFNGESASADYIQWSLGGSVILESEWNQEPTARWILLDQSSPGLFKWGRALGPWEETSSLLESVSLVKQPDSEGLYYEIYAAMDAVSDNALAIYKFIDGNAANADDEFTFTADLYDAGGIPLTDSYAYEGSGGADNGVIASGDTVKLKGMQGVTISGLPMQTRYRVVENEANTNGYSTEAHDDEGIIEGTTGFDSTRLIFLNESSALPGGITREIADTLDSVENANKATVIFINTKNDSGLPPTEPERPQPAPGGNPLTFTENRIPLTPGIEITIPEEPIPLEPLPNPDTGLNANTNLFTLLFAVYLSCLLLRCLSGGKRGRK